jgi:flavin reductase (DIM6/NTAB) family NADH-FMN oxidoreductase RutF
VVREVDAGDHVVVLLGIDALEAAPQTAPLVFHQSRFHHLMAIDAPA